MTLKSLASAALFTAAMTPAAFADATAFEGFYGGFSLGVTTPDSNFFPLDAGSGIGGDVFVGYNFAAGPNWIIGGELSYGMSAGFSALGGAITYDLDDILTVSGRAGYVFGNTMIYGRVGYQTGTMNANFLPLDANTEGYMLGLGLEQMFAENISGRIEISQSYLDVPSIFVPPGTDLDMTRISVGVALHF